MITHFDCIKAMSAEEFAEWITCVELRILKMKRMLERPAIKEDWLNFLNQPAEQGGLTK